MSESLNEIINLNGMRTYGKAEHENLTNEEKTAYRNGSGDSYTECAKLANKAKRELNIEIVLALREAAFGENMTLNIAIEEVNKIFNT